MNETDTSQKCTVQVKSIRHKSGTKYDRSSKVRNVKIDADAATNDTTSCTRSNAEEGVTLGGDVDLSRRHVVNAASQDAKDSHLLHALAAMDTKSDALNAE